MIIFPSKWNSHVYVNNISRRNYGQNGNVTNFNLHLLGNLKDSFRPLHDNRGHPAGRFVCIGAFISTLCRRVSPHRRSRIRTACVTSYFCGRTDTHTRMRLHSHSVPLYLCYSDSGLCLTLIFCFPSKYGTPLRLNREFPFKRGPRKRKMLHWIKTIFVHLVFYRDNFKNNEIKINLIYQRMSWNLF